MGESEWLVMAVYSSGVSVFCASAAHELKDLTEMKA